MIYADNEKDLSFWETYCIRENGTLSPNGYNLNFGGEGHGISEETRHKLSEARKGEKNPFYGHHHSKETKEYISRINSGENHPNYGKHLNEETKRKISSRHKGKALSDETKDKISKKIKLLWHNPVYREAVIAKMRKVASNRTYWNKGEKLPDWLRYKLSKAHIGQKHKEETKKKIKLNRFRYIVKCVELDKIYNSCSEAFKELGIHSYSILRVIKGLRKTAGGYHWELVETYKP